MIKGHALWNPFGLLQLCLPLRISRLEQLWKQILPDITQSLSDEHPVVVTAPHEILIFQSLLGGQRIRAMHPGNSI